jgi:hypothetical protein
MANIGNQFWRLRLKDGREKSYESFEDLALRCYEYFEFKENDYEYVEESHVKEGSVMIRKKTPLLFEELYTFLGISRNTWKNYKERGNDFLTLYTHVEDIINGQKKRGAYIGIFNANIVKADLGMVDKTETKNTHEVEVFKGIDLNVTKDNGPSENI